uniref:Uncharacterized protein n=1 Tax=Oryza brachyantha TaxID=4533 RepID=J3KXG4_ORYBR
MENKDAAGDATEQQEEEKSESPVENPTVGDATEQQQQEEEEEEQSGSPMENPTVGDAAEQQQPRREKWKAASAAESAARLDFLRAALDDVLRYIEMTEEDVVEEYRRAGKLHKYDPDKEWQKRFARVARAHPPPPSFLARIPKYEAIP